MHENKCGCIEHDDRESWVAWLSTYGIGRFYDAFVAMAQDVRSRCVYCNAPIYLDIVEGGGVPDWKLADGDYGCYASPDSDEDGCGSHRPEKLEDF